jgi:hypothetical protein
VLKNLLAAFPVLFSASIHLDSPLDTRLHRVIVANGYAVHASRTVSHDNRRRAKDHSPQQSGKLTRLPEMRHNTTSIFCMIESPKEPQII